MISKEKIKSVDYLFNRIISERVRDSMEPKYSLLLGAGCSASSGIVLAKDIINMLKSIAYIRELPAGNADNPFLNMAYGNLIPFLQDWYEKNNTDESFLKFVDMQNEQIGKGIEEKIKNSEGYFEEVFHGILIREYPNYGDMSYEEKQKILSKILDEHKTEITWDMEYSYWFAKYSTASEDINSFLTELMNKKNPSEAYIFLADLFVNHMFSVAFTTNFDDLLGESLSLLGVRSKNIWFDNTLSKTFPNIIKLHGDYMYNNTKNLSNETMRLASSLYHQMENVLSKGGLIVIGYSGADNSIMYTLERMSEKYLFPLFWCELEDKISEDKVHWRTRNLILNSSNAYFVPIKKFDTLVEALRMNYMLYAKLRKNIRNEIIYEEEYLKTALQRIKAIIDKAIEQNNQISKEAVPVPPPDKDWLRKYMEERK